MCWVLSMCTKIRVGQNHVPYIYIYIYTVFCKAFLAGKSPNIRSYTAYIYIYIYIYTVLAKPMYHTCTCALGLMLLEVGKVLDCLLGMWCS